MSIPRQIWIGPKAGKISDLRIIEESLAVPRPGECRVRIKSIGLNFADVFTALGLYSATPAGQYTPGLEFSGVVEEVAKGHVDKLDVGGYELGQDSSVAAERAADTLKVGDSVVGVTRFGAYASHLNVPAHLVRPLPSGWSFNQGAGFLVQGLTTWYGLSALGNLRSGSTVLVHSAAGGCGLFALKICQKIGAKVVGTVGSDQKRKFLIESFPGLLKESSIVVRKDARQFGKQLDDALAAVDAKHFDVVLDAVLGDYFRPGYARVGPGGRYVVYGAASMTPAGDRVNWLKLAWRYIRRPRLDLLSMPSENRSVMAFNLIWMFENYGLLSRLLDELMGLELEPPFVGQTFAFERAPDALRAFQSGKTVGKVVLEV